MAPSRHDQNIILGQTSIQKKSYETKKACQEKKHMQKSVSDMQKQKPPDESFHTVTACDCMVLVYTESN